jgi:hypothetical protein
LFRQSAVQLVEKKRVRSMCLNWRLQLLIAAVSVLAAAASVVVWFEMSRQDVYLPLGNRWYIAGRPDRWEFNMDNGGWSMVAPVGGDGGFFPSGFNATFTLERHFAASAGMPPEWGDATVGSIKVHNFILGCFVNATAWGLASLLARRRRVARGFPIET